VTGLDRILGPGSFAAFYESSSFSVIAVSSPRSGVQWNHGRRRLWLELFSGNRSALRLGGLSPCSSSLARAGKPPPRQTTHGSARLLFLWQEGRLHRGALSADVGAVRFGPGPGRLRSGQPRPPELYFALLDNMSIEVLSKSGARLAVLFRAPWVLRGFQALRCPRRIMVLRPE
jgi:hypothetical protein